MAEQLNAISRSVDNEWSKLVTTANKCHDGDINSGTSNVGLLNLKLWMAAYKNINSSAKLYNDIFSMQVNTQNK